MIYQPAEDSSLLSEVLKEQLVKLIKKNPNLTFLEIGVGSGIQLQTALKAGVKKQNIFGVDINLEAVQYCKKLGFNCRESDLFENVKQRFDIIVFNPPYLPEDKNESKDSKIATTGGKKGGEIINRFLDGARSHLKDDGKVFLLTSSLTKSIEWRGFKKDLLAKEKVFFEELYCWRLR